MTGKKLERESRKRFEAQEKKRAARKAIDKQIYGLTPDGKLNPAGNGRRAN
jgi:hypothetical protein